MREYREIDRRDVGRVFFKAFGRKWRTDGFIGQILPHDVGKRVFLVGGILQVENDEQRAARLKARLVEVYDERAYIPGNPKHLATHLNVPRDWTTREVLDRLGIGEHLTVYMTDDEGRRVLHRGA